ncbi:RNA_helicase [Hexamita inflata]|uniref:ATP-dependent RNA helicase n=1 Tax=Hexamita inflata TaxID=28002 RepID=A0AA86TBG5_9EUKA|nr:RNA helicase [Hexamita inflata]CAI9947288.1 RNA helicase [Hexamita inflata]
MKSWQQFNLQAPLLAALQQRKYKFPLPVQQQVIPMALKNEDVVVQSETGSGKTLSFVVPVINFLLKNSLINPDILNNEIKPVNIEEEIKKELEEQTNKTGKSKTQLRKEKKQNRKDEKKEDVQVDTAFPIALIIVPTRVLALQIVQVFQEFGIDPGQLIGGQYTNIHNPVIIGTPGKVAFSIIESVISTQKLRFLIVDEADKTIQMPEALDVFKRCPKQQRLSLLFSATINKNSPALNQISQKFSFVQIQEDDYRIPDKLDCWYITVPIEQKMFWLCKFVGQVQKSVIFTLTCNFSKYLHLILTEIYPNRQILYLHGKQSSHQQLDNYNKFISADNAILITTDIAARGLDVDSLGVVLQFDPPKSLDTFIHRAGRTARNGQAGQAGVFFTANEVGVVKLLQARGLPIVEKKISDVFSPSTADETGLLSQQMLWTETECDGQKIGTIKKQLKKLTFQAQQQLDRGVKQYEVDRQFGQAIQDFKSQLEPLLEQEQEMFKAQQSVYDHPLTVFQRNLQLKDRQNLDYCQQAFISYVRAYKEYELKVILNLNNVKLGPLAMSFGMLVLPRVAELKQFFLNFKKWDGDLTTVAYLEKQKEQLRLKRLEEQNHSASEDEVADTECVVKPDPLQKQKIQSGKNVRFPKGGTVLEPTKPRKPLKKELDSNTIDEKMFGSEKELFMLLKNGEIDDEEFERKLEKMMK